MDLRNHRLRRSDHRLGVRRQRGCTPGRGEGLSLGVLDGKRWKDENIPKTNGIFRVSYGCQKRGCTGSRGSSTWTMCSSSPALAWAAARTCLSSPGSSVGRLTTSRFDLPHLVLKHRDPLIDRMGAGRGSARAPCIIELIDPCGSEECAYVVWGEAVQLF